MRNQGSTADEIDRPNLANAPPGARTIRGGQFAYTTQAEAVDKIGME
jgi:hypothetical protein